MSLVITSSSQQEYDRNSKVKIGLENPASYQNFLKSPLIVDKDSEVALVSLKCNIDEDTIVIDSGAGEGLFLYWGSEGSDNYDGTGGYPHKMDDINTPMRIELLEGAYTRRSFMNHLKERLDDVMKKAYKEIDTITVTESLDTNNVFQGFNIQFVQKGNGSGFTNKPSHTEFGAYIDEGTFLNLVDDDTYQAVEQYTDNFVASASGTDVLITGYNATAEGPVCDVIGKAHPLSQVKSKCEIYFNGSSASNVTDGYTLGLVRSQGYTNEEGTYDVGTPSGFGGDVVVDDSVNKPAGYTGDDDGVPPFFWDVAFNWAPGEDGQVVHCINDNDGEETTYQMNTITLQNTPTNASLQAKYWDRVIFEVTGEKIDVKLGVSGSTATTTLVSSGSTTFGERVKPMGVTCNQLYPKIAIHNNDDTSPGTAWLTTWNGHEALGYYENNFYGLVGLDDPYTPFPEFCFIGETGVDGVPLRIDLSSIYANGKILTLDDAGAEQDYTYKGELAGHRGIDNKYVFITSEYNDKTNNPLYFTTSDQAETISEKGKLGDILGFPAVADQTEYATIADSGADITFSSPNLPDFAPQESMFVRLKNMAINTYNANKQSISNIIYACPKFDAQGNTGGLLFYEPAERVYVKLNNSEKMIVNSLDIDLVNVNEKVIERSVGNTLVVLHFRKSK
jgi:hypothetical protein